MLHQHTHDRVASTTSSIVLHGPWSGPQICSVSKRPSTDQGSDMCGFGAGRLPFSERHAETMGGRLLPVRFMARRRSCDEDVRQRIWR